MFVFPAEYETRDLILIRLQMKLIEISVEFSFIAMQKRGEKIDVNQFAMLHSPFQLIKLQQIYNLTLSAFL